jgi:hypothetical protein
VSFRSIPLLLAGSSHCSRPSACSLFDRGACGGGAVMTTGRRACAIVVRRRLGRLHGAIRIAHRWFARAQSLTHRVGASLLIFCSPAPLPRLSLSRPCARSSWPPPPRPTRRSTSSATDGSPRSTRSGQVSTPPSSSSARAPEAGCAIRECARQAGCNPTDEQRPGNVRAGLYREESPR